MALWLRAVTSTLNPSMLGSSILLLYIQAFLQGLSFLRVMSLLGGLIVSYLAYNIFFHPLSSIPGPLSARLGIPSFRFLNACASQYAWNHKALHDKYGETVRAGPNIVTTTNAEVVRTIYGHGTGFPKTTFYSAFSSIRSTPSLFSDIDPQSHASRRRSVAHVYSMKSLVEFEEYVEPHIQLLIERLDQQARNGAEEGSPRAIEISKWLHYFAADTVAELAFGMDLGLLKAGKDATSLLPAILNLTKIGAIGGTVPSIGTFVRWILHRVTPLSPAIIGIKTWKQVNQRYKVLAASHHEATQRRDMLTGFIIARYPGTNVAYAPLDVVSHATSAFGAGSDTTAAAMMGFFFYVLTNPPVYKRLQAEIDSAFEDGRIQLPVMYAQGVKLNYLQACIKESMRLFTPVGMEMPRVVPEGGTLIGKHFLPAGTHVGANAFVFHRAESAYGPDAEVFRPERWLNVSEQTRALMERNNLAFGAGSRVCIGKNISLMEMSKILPTLLWRYSFSITPRSDGSPHHYTAGRSVDGKESRDAPWRLYSSWFFEVKDFWCDIELRRSEEGINAGQTSPRHEQLV